MPAGFSLIPRLLIPAVLAAWAARPGAMAMEVPRPDKVKHPGAEQAPAGSPATYPDEEGFQKRAKVIVEGLAKEDLSKWRKGYFQGGDPGKYLIGACVARQLLNEKDEEAVKYMSDNRTPKERYHFAIVNWARYAPLFGHTLPEAVFKQVARVDGGMLGNVGTENHVAMWRTSAVVMSTFREGGRAQGKDWLKNYVRGLYHFGQGEWDSSTYMIFDLNGLLNVYDFSKDDECRLLAKAGLDWFGAAYALKYVNGMHTGPKERGYTDGAVESLADQTGWLWWDSTADPGARAAGFRHSVHAVTSAWRPNRVLCNIARRKLPKLPFETRNSKPNYWVGLDGPPAKPVANVSQESLYVAPEFTLGTMWYSEDTCCQLMRLQLGVKTKDGAVSFTGSHVGQNDGKDRFLDGQGALIYHEGKRPVTKASYVQYCQVGSTVACMAKLPADERNKFTYFTLPEAAGEPKQDGNWRVFQVGEVFAAVHPLTPTVENGELAGKKPLKYLKFPGDATGFVLTAAGASRFRDLDAFLAALRGTGLDASAFAKDLTVSFRTLDGRAVRMQYREGRKQAAVSVDGAEVNYEDWPVYDGPYVRQKDGILTVNDGQEGFVVDFSGEMPVYRSWKP